MKKILLYLLLTFTISSNATVYLVQQGGTSPAWSGAARIGKSIVDLSTAGAGSTSVTFGAWYTANAAAFATGDQVWVIKGTYLFGATFDNKAASIYGGFGGAESTIEERAKPLNAKYWEFTNETIFDGNNAVKIINGSSNTLTTIYEGLTFANMRGSVGLRGQETVQNCIFKNNTIAGGGAAVLMYKSGAIVKQSYFYNNSATGASPNGIGGAIYVLNAQPTATPNIIQDCFFENNAAPSNGAAIYIAGVSATVQNCLITGSMGGSFIYTNNASNFYNNTFVNNSGSAGMYISGTPEVKVYNTVFWGGTASFSGGNASTTQVKNCAMMNSMPNASWTLSDNISIENTNTGSDLTKFYTGFTNPANKDFTLSNASSLIDRGSVVTGLTSDFFGNIRPQGAAFDLGYYESDQTRVYDEMSQLYLRLYTNAYNVNVGNLSLLSTQQSDGRWPDINYADRNIVNWEPRTHLERLQSLSKSYCEQVDKTTATAVNLLTGIEKGLNAWFTGGFKSNNWWFNEIAAPGNIGTTVTLMKNYLQPATLNTACGYLKIYGAPTGTNLVWEASILLIRGAVLNNVNDVTNGIAYMESTIVPSAKGFEGIQQDNSYLFHGLQLYSTGYGMATIFDVTKWMYLTRGLSFGFSTGSIETMRGFILDGNQWMLRRGQFDFGTAGRTISRPNGFKASSMKTPLSNMKEIDPANSTAYQNTIDHVNGLKDGSLTGNKHFYRADYMSQKGAAYHLSVKMCSNRTKGTESINGENLKGFWMPFGATCLMKDAAEYSLVFPLWNWSRVPGVTATQEVPSFYDGVTQTSIFVGGVSNGRCGVAAMDLDKQSLVAKKSYFMFDNETVCLGAGITSTNVNAVNTSLAQSILRGAVNIDGMTVPVGTNVAYNNAKWIAHDNVAYFFPQTANIKLSNSSRSDSWYNVSNAESAATVTQSLFDAYIFHGVKPTNASYSYIIVPQIILANVKAYSDNLPVKILSNTATLQAATQSTQKLTGAVFYSAGQLVVDVGLTVSVDQPCALMIDQSKSQVEITVSDPAQTKTSVNVTLKYANSPTEVMSILLPTGDAAGSSVSKTGTTSTAVQSVESENIEATVIDKTIKVQLHDNYSGTKIMLLDVTGRVLNSQQATNSIIELSLPNSYYGIAILLVKTTKSTLYKKFIIQ